MAINKILFTFCEPAKKKIVKSLEAKQESKFWREKNFLEKKSLKFVAYEIGEM